MKVGGKCLSMISIYLLPDYALPEEAKWIFREIPSSFKVYIEKYTE